VRREVAGGGRTRRGKSSVFGTEGEGTAGKEKEEKKGSLRCSGRKVGKLS